MTKHHDRFVFVFSLLAGGLISLLLGKELNWDVANYHYYLPYLYLHHRQNIDYWPTSYIQQFFNPAIDFLTYFLINLKYSAVATFILGAIQGLMLYVLYHIALLFLETKNRCFIAFFLACVGMYSPNILPNIGSFQNDNIINLFTLGFVYYILVAIKNKNQLALSVGSLILGLGFGLKLTTGSYVLAGAISLLFIPPVSRPRTLLLFGAGISLGFLITAGYWMLQMWQAHHSPLFPFFNAIFQSPDFPASNYRDARYLPTTWLQTFFYPFYFSFDGRTADIPFFDVRFIIIYILVVARLCEEALFADEAIQKKIPGLLRRAKSMRSSQRRSIWLILFFITAYIAWQHYFSIARYLTTLEALCPLVIYLLIRSFTQKKCYLYAAFFLIIILMIPTYAVRVRWYEGTYFNVQLPNEIKKINEARVLIAYPAFVYDTTLAAAPIHQQPKQSRTPNPRPQSYLIPFFAESWQFIGVPFWNKKPHLDKALTLAKLKEKNLPIYLLTSDLFMPALLKTSQDLGLTQNGKCMKITSDRQMITNQETLLCPVRFIREN